MKDKTTAALLAFFLGGIGIHKFYLGRGGQGIIYLLFFWTFIPAMIAFIEFFILIFMNDHEFNMRFNPQLVGRYQHPQQIAQNVTVNLPSNFQAASVPNVTEQLTKLNELRVAGALTEEEFTAQKRKLLNS